MQLRLHEGEAVAREVRNEQALDGGVAALVGTILARRRPHVLGVVARADGIEVDALRLPRFVRHPALLREGIVETQHCVDQGAFACVTQGSKGARVYGMCMSGDREGDGKQGTYEEHRTCGWPYLRWSDQ